MADRHLNLFYTYNRDTELIENNLTRAFIVFLSIVSGTTRQKVLTTLLNKLRNPIGDPIEVEDLDFSDACFALQSNIDRHLTDSSGRKLLLTISTELLDIASGTTMTDLEPADESEDNSGGSTSVPDAWIYSSSWAYCVLIEAKVGSYPLNGGQLEAHARDWFGSSLQSLNSSSSLWSVTWLDVLETLKETLENAPHKGAPEEALLSHLMEFISYYGYRLFEGFDFTGLRGSPNLVIGHPAPPERLAPSDVEIQGLNFHRLASPPKFVLSHPTPGSHQGGTR